MRTHVGVIILSALLISCSTRSTPLPVYTPAAANVEGIGYDAVQTGPNRWRVWYTLKQHSGRDLAEQYALRHAAEITHSQGAAWFRVLYEASPNHNSGYRPVDRSGALQPAFEQQAPQSGPLGFARNWLGVSPVGQVTAVMDIELGAGPRPGGAFDAQTIIQSYP